MSKKNTKKKNNSKSTKTQNQSQQNKNLNKNQQSKNQQNNNQQNKNQQNKSPQNKNQQSKSQQSNSPQNKNQQSKSQQSNSPQNKSQQSNSPQNKSQQSNSPQNKSQQNKSPQNKNQQSKSPQNKNQYNHNQQGKKQQNQNLHNKKQQGSIQQKSTKNKEIRVKEDNEIKESQLKSVMNSMEKLNRENKIGNSSKVEKESGEKTVDSNFDTLMDFSKIDDEYKGELRRKLTPKERFFRTCEKFGDLFILNCLFTLTSIPIVTIGASFTAMYSVTFKMVRNEDVPIKDGYFKAFKRNFKQSTTLWVGLLVFFYLIYLQLKNVMSTTAKSGNFLVMVVGMQLMFLSFLIPLLFPMIARYENTNFNMLKNSLLASFLHLGTWATVFFLWMIPVMLYLLKPNLFFYTWYLWLVFLSAFVAYTCSFRLRNMFDKIEEDPVKKMIEDEQEQGRQQNEEQSIKQKKYQNEEKKQEHSKKKEQGRKQGK